MCWLLPGNVHGLMRWGMQPTKCLGVYQGLTHNGNPLILIDCDGLSLNQQWQLDHDLVRWKTHPSKCIDVYDTNAVYQSIPIAGTKLQLWDCDKGSPTMLWRKDGELIRFKHHPSMCLHVNTTVTTHAQISDCGVNNSAQMWSTFWSTSCPATHPYAYHRFDLFDYCCSTSDDCDGNIGVNAGPRPTGASCCNSQYQPCEVPPCQDYDNAPPPWKTMPYQYCSGHFISDFKSRITSSLLECKEACLASPTCFGVTFGANSAYDTEAKCILCTSDETVGAPWATTYIRGIHLSPHLCTRPTYVP